MTIQFSCHGCGRPFHVPDNMARSKARCNSCGAVVTVPSKSQPLLEPLQEERPTRPVTPTRPAAPVYPAAPQQPSYPPSGYGAYGYTPPSSSAPIPKGVLWGGIAAAVLFVIGVVGWFTVQAVLSRLRPTEVATNNPNGTIETNLEPIPFSSGSTTDSGSATGSSSSSTFKPIVPPTTVPSLPGTSPSSPNSGTASSSNFSPASANKLPNDLSGASPISRTGEPFRNPANEMAIGGDIPSPTNPTPRKNREASNSEADYWQATIDPPIQPMEVKKGPLNIQLDGFGSKVLFPRSPSNFVLVSGRIQQEMVNIAFDLRTGKALGKPITEHFDFQTGDFNGRYFVGPAQHGKEHVVWSFATGELALAIKTDHLGFRPHCYLAGQHDLVLTGLNSGFMNVEIWNLQEKKLARQFVIGAKDTHWNENSVAFSHGGKYLVALAKDHLEMVELAAEKTVGVIRLPEEISDCEAVSFSHDGSLLAAIAGGREKKRLLVLDVASGRWRLNSTLDTKLWTWNSAGVSVLDWLPDNSAVFYRGQQIVDIATASLIWTFPKPNHACRILGTDRILAVVQEKKQTVLTNVAMPEKEILKGFEAVQAGGMAVDAALPPLTKANLLSAKPVTLPNGFVNWTSSVDPAPTLRRNHNRDVKLASENDTVVVVRFGGPDSGKVAVQKVVKGQREMNAIERVDLITGAASGQLPLPNTYRLLDVSPGGDLALVGFLQGDRWNAKGFDRIDLLGFSPKKHLAGWRPYENEPDEAGEDRFYFQKLEPKLATWVGFINNSLVATVSGAGKLIVWKMPECEPVYYFDKFGEPVAVSAGRQYLAGVHEGQFRLFDAATGECRGDLEAPQVGMKPLRASFSQDGKRLVAIIDGGLDRILVLWNLETGKIESEFPIHPDTISHRSTFFVHSSQGTNLGLEWRGDRYLMLDDEFLIDLVYRAVIWKYHVGYSTQLAAGSPDTRTWMVGAKESFSKGPKVLNSLALPGSGTVRLAAGNTLAKQILLGPGSNVRLVVDTSSTGMQGMQETVAKALSEGLATRGITIDTNATLTMSLTTKQESTGNQLTVESTDSFGFPLGRWFGGPRGRQPSSGGQSFAQQKMVCTLAIKNTNNEVLWKTEAGVAMPVGVVVNKDSAQADAQKMMQDGFRDLLASGRFTTNGFPQFIFYPLEKALSGESMLTMKGEEPPPPKKQPNASGSGASQPAGLPSIPRPPGFPR